MGEGGGLIYQLATALILAGAVYGGIRSDLRAMKEHIARVEKDSDKAHDRIDALGFGRRHNEK